MSSTLTNQANSERHTHLTALPYHIDRWSDGYFGVNNEGELTVNLPMAPGSRSQKTSSHQDVFSFQEIAQAVHQQGLRLPVLLRFTSILHDRVNQLVSAFNAETDQQGYTGRYQVVYPIKVNQQRRVVEEIIRSEPSASNNQVGLEAGSKPELLAVLALAPKPGTCIVCNGYKDREYIRMALLGQSLGYSVTLVLEKPSELKLILQEAEQLQVLPRIGLRARLSSIGKGKWQNTGGEKSKFGLSSQQILSTLAELKHADKLDCLQLLHFHLGSQIANIRDIQNGLQECAVIYAQLRKLGAPVSTVDIGGGLGIDYDGTESRNVCSINYRTQDYARKVVEAFKECCDAHELPHPDIISESGRALTAHHAVLMTDIVETESPNTEEITQEVSTKIPAIKHLWSDYQALLGQQSERSLIEIYHDAKHAIDDVHTLFIQGQLSLSEQSEAEQLYTAVCNKLRDKLTPLHRDHLDIIDELNERLADKLFVNFSLFQSTPDVWGIDQVFPILPTQGLNQALTRRGIIQDITCDSDGRVDAYVSNQGLQSSLALPPRVKSDVPELICFFLVGAYQEILGDMHNLFGDTDSVDVAINDKGELKLEHAIRGDDIASVLNYVNLNPETLLQKFRDKIATSALDQADRDKVLLAFETGLASYTYLGS